MAERIALDTGTIIALACADALEIVASLPIEFLAPVEVRDELDEGVRLGHHPASATWVRFAPLREPIRPALLADLDPGEAAVIQLALERGIAIVGIDERKGRRAAHALGLQVTGSLGLLGRAKAHGLVPAVRPYIDRMQAASVWFDDELVERFLAQLDE